MKPRGDIFDRRDGTPGEKVPFDQAFPEIEAIDAAVHESGEGNVGLGVRKFNRRSVREYINCSSHLCGGKGVALGALLRDMVSRRETTTHVERACESQEESGLPCPNRFSIDLTITYYSR